MSECINDFDFLMNSPEIKDFRCEHGKLLTQICVKCATMQANKQRAEDIERHLYGTKK